VTQAAGGVSEASDADTGASVRPGERGVRCKRRGRGRAVRYVVRGAPRGVG
jgi:hypothetical protein